MSWLEISLHLDGELVEPATELLTRIAPTGLVVEPFGDGHLLRAWIPQDDQTESRKNLLERGLWHLSQITPFPQPRYREIPERDWEAVWRGQYRPLPVGDRLLIQPIVPREGRSASVSGLPDTGSEAASPSSPWSDAFELITDPDGLAPDPDRLTIYLEPGMAFGTGTHPTTRHCLELLEQRVRPGDRVLDLGCGSGVLAIAAVRLGAGSVLGVDIDADAVALARRNLAHNDLSEQVRIEAGSLAAVPTGAQFDLIVGNIHAAVIEQLLQEQIGARLDEAGTLILAGILDDQLAGIEGHAAQAGLQLEEQRASGDWRTLVLRPATRATPA